ncbi:MAG: hypothetical protein WBE76_17535 [Terracidiphilus sp.]
MNRFPVRRAAVILGFSILAFLVMGYHPGLEDDGVYLSAVKSDLNPALYPHDSQFFRVQLEATVFDRCVAGFVRVTHVPVASAELIWQFASIVLIVFACWSIARRLFDDKRAQWAGVALVAAMLTLPVAGTALNLADQHLHPRNLATGLILAAVAQILAGRRRQAAVLLLLAFVLHPIMAALGISYCFFLTVAIWEPVHVWLRSWRDSLAGAAPLAWILEPPSNSWREAVKTRPFYFPLQWTWYEGLGAVAPLFLFWLLWRIALKRGETLLARFALAVLAYGVFQQAIALIVTSTPALIRLTPLQPMRYLQLIYYFLALVGGCLTGKYILRAWVWRWVLFLVAINLGMFSTQRMMFGASAHLELPARRPSNPWLQAFAWIRENTPADAYFALDPYYLAAPGEDYHSFRALAERSQLADAVKDTAMVTQVPELGPIWHEQLQAQAGWSRFQLADFERLKKDFGVNWALVSYPAQTGLDCRWHNDVLSVCRIP